MFSFRRKRAGTTRSDNSGDGRHLNVKWRRAGDVVLLVAATLVVIYAVSVAAQALDSYTMVRSTPLSSIRLQVIDASGKSGLLATALNDIKSVADETLALEIIQTTAFDLRDVSQSYLVSRLEDCRAAGILAEKLGLEPDDVEHKPLINNNRQITATLVLGSNGLAPIIAQAKEEET